MASKPSSGKVKAVRGTGALTPPTPAPNRKGAQFKGKVAASQPKAAPLAAAAQGTAAEPVADTNLASPSASTNDLLRTELRETRLRLEQLERLVTTGAAGNTPVPANPPEHKDVKPSVHIEESNARDGTADSQDVEKLHIVEERIEPVSTGPRMPRRIGDPPRPKEQPEVSQVIIPRPPTAEKLPPQDVLPKAEAIEEASKCQEVEMKGQPQPSPQDQPEVIVENIISARKDLNEVRGEETEPVPIELKGELAIGQPPSELSELVLEECTALSTDAEVAPVVGLSTRCLGAYTTIAALFNNNPFQAMFERLQELHEAAEASLTMFMESSNVNHSMATNNMAVALCDSPTAPSGRPLLMDTEGLQKYGQQVDNSLLFDRSTRPNLVEIDKCLRTLREQKAKDEGLHFQNSIECAVESLKKAEAIIRGTQLSSTKWSDVVSPVLQFLSHVMKLPTYKQKLVGIEEEIRRSSFTVEEIAHEQSVAVSEGHMELAEAKYKEKIEAQEILSNLILKQLELIDAAVAEWVKKPQSMLKDQQNQANGKFTSYSRNNKILLQQVEKDIAGTTDHIARLTEMQTEGAKAVLEEVAKSKLVMGANQKRQTQCWTTILEKFEELQHLSNERVAEVQRHIQLIEDYRTRSTDIHQSLVLLRARLSALECTKMNVDAVDDITEECADGVGALCRGMEFFLHRREEEADTAKTNVHKQHLHEFRSVYLTLGELAYRKEQYTSQLNKRVACLQEQQDMYSMSFNPKAKEIADMRKEVTKTLNDASAYLNSLKSKSKDLLVGFRVTELALKEKGVDFVHPAEELQSINDQRQVKLLEYERLSPHDVLESDEAARAAARVLALPPASRKALSPLAGGLESPRSGTISTRGALASARSGYTTG